MLPLLSDGAAGKILSGRCRCFLMERRGKCLSGSYCCPLPARERQTLFVTVGCGTKCAGVHGKRILPESVPTEGKAHRSFFPGRSAWNRKKQKSPRVKGPQPLASLRLPGFAGKRIKISDFLPCGFLWPSSLRTRENRCTRENPDFSKPKTLSGLSGGAPPDLIPASRLRRETDAF